MKLKLKMIAAAAAMVTLASGAQAAIVTSGQSGDLVLVAFNSVTGTYYMRDLDLTLSGFLPTGALNSVGLTGSTIVGDRTPNAGLTLNGGNTPTFAGDSLFTSWYGSQTAADVRWFVSAVDSISAAATGVSRLITSSFNPSETASNGQVSNYVTGGNAAGGLTTFFGATSAQSVTDVTSGASLLAPLAEWNSNFGLGGDGLGTVGSSGNLFYFTRTQATSATTTAANGGAFQNTTGLATVTLAANGDFTYFLAGETPTAVPLPAAAWLMGAGLLGLGGAARRRKAAAQAVAA